MPRAERLRVLEDRRRIRSRAAAARAAADRAYGAYLAAVEAGGPDASDGLREVIESRRRMAAADLARFALAGYGDRSHWPQPFRRITG